MWREIASTAVITAALLATVARAETDAELIARAQAIHDRVLTIDTHVDIPADFSTDAYDMMKPGPRGQQVHLPTMESGGLDAPFIIVFVGQGERNTAGYAKALSDAFVKFAAIHRLTSKLYPEKIELAYSAEDVRRIHAAGKKVAVIGIENGYAIGKDVTLLDQFHEYGARYFGLVHNGHNDLADSAQPDQRRFEPAAEWNGLSPLGREVVQRLNELGIMVDVSHSSDKATLDMVAASKAPVIASHSGVRGVYDHPRNLSDAALEAIQRNGGVVQVIAFDTYLHRQAPERAEAMRALLSELGLRGGDIARMTPEQGRVYDAKLAEINRKWPKATVKALADHIDYTVRKIGVDHVGISSDFNGGGGIDGWENAGETFNVTLELVKRGYSEQDVAKIWGGNLLRVMEKVEQAAQKTRIR